MAYRHRLLANCSYLRVLFARTLPCFELDPLTDAEVAREESNYIKRRTRGFKCVVDSHSIKSCYDVQHELQH